MKDIMTQKLLSYVEYLEGVGKNGVDALSQEIPLFVKELLQWMIIDNCITAIGMGLLCTILVIVCYRMHRLAVSKFNDWSENPWVVLYVLIVALMFPTIQSGIIATHAAKKATKTYIAPRVVLVEEIRNLVQEQKPAQ